MDTIGNRIKLLRETRKESQKDFAEKVCVSPSYLSRVEHDKEKPTDMLLKLISLEFDCSLWWLREGLGSMNYIKDGDYFDRDNSDAFRLGAINNCSNLLLFLSTNKDKPGTYRQIDFIIGIINDFLKNDNNSKATLMIEILSDHCASFLSVIDAMKKKDSNYIDISHVLETDAKDTFEKIEELYNFDLDSNAK